MQVKFRSTKFVHATLSVLPTETLFNICLKVLNFDIGASNIPFVILEELLIQFK